MEGFHRLLLLMLCYFIVYVTSDGVETYRNHRDLTKKLRDNMANQSSADTNQTTADTLNLPANATSIRPNITDTFRCENRTYGYYADVDNECQVFHVCLTTQSASGRNTTYRWSFICPNETVFNQEVLTCTRPRDSIPCEESPQYYDLNMEIGKTNDTRNGTKPMEQMPMNNNNMRRHNNQKVQNMLIEDMNMRNQDLQLKKELKNMKITDMNMNKQDMSMKDQDTKEKLQIEDGIKMPDEIEPSEEEFGEKIEEPVIHEVGKIYETKKGNARLALERSLFGKNIGRGVFRFSDDN